MRLRPAFIYNDESKNEEVFDEEKLQILKEMAEATKKLKKQDKRIKPTTNMEKKHMILEGNWFTYEDSSGADNEEQQDGFDLAESVMNANGTKNRYLCNICSCCNLDELELMKKHVGSCVRTQTRQAKRLEDIVTCQLCSAEILHEANHYKSYHGGDPKKKKQKEDHSLNLHDRDDDVIYARKKRKLVKEGQVTTATSNTQSINTRNAAAELLKFLKNNGADALSLQELNIKSLSEQQEFFDAIADLGFTVIFCEQSSRVSNRGSSVLIISSALGTPDLLVSEDVEGVETILVEVSVAGFYFFILGLYAAPLKLHQEAFALADEGPSPPVIVLGDLNARSKAWDHHENAQGKLVRGWMNEFKLVQANDKKLPTRKVGEVETAPDVVLFSEQYFSKANEGEWDAFRTAEVEWSDHKVVVCSLQINDGDWLLMDEEDDAEEKQRQEEITRFVKAFKYAHWTSDGGYVHDDWHTAYGIEVDSLLIDSKCMPKLWPYEEGGLRYENLFSNGDPMLWMDAQDASFELERVRDVIWKAGLKHIPNKTMRNGKKSKVEEDASIPGGEEALKEGAKEKPEKKKRETVKWDQLSPKDFWREVNKERNRRAWSTGFPKIMVKNTIEARRSYLKRAAEPDDKELKKVDMDDQEQVNAALKKRKVCKAPTIDEATRDPGEITKIFTNFFRTKVNSAYAAAGVEKTPHWALRKKKEELIKDGAADEWTRDEDWRLTLVEFRAAIRGLDSGRSPGFDRISHEMLLGLRGTRTEILLFRIYAVLLARGWYPPSGSKIQVAPVGKLPRPVYLESLMRPVSLCSCFAKLMDRILDRRASLLLDGKTRSFSFLNNNPGGRLAKIQKKLADEAVDPQTMLFDERPKAMPTYSVAYRKGYSKEVAAVILIDFIFSVTVAFVLLNDCLQGFDVVDHPTAVDAFRMFGAPKSFCLLVAGFLYNRFLSVRSGRLWRLCPGKPQGSPFSGSVYNALTSLVNRELLKKFADRVVQACQYSDDISMAHTEEVEGLQDELAAVGKRRYQFYDADKHRKIKYDRNNPKKVKKPGKSLGYVYDGTYDFRSHAKGTLSQIRAEFHSIKKLRGMRVSKKCDVALATSYPAMSSNAVPTFPYYNKSTKKAVVSTMSKSIKKMLSLPKRCPSYNLYRGSGLPDPGQLFFVEGLSLFARGVSLGVWDAKEVRPLDDASVEAPVVGSLVKERTIGTESLEYPERRTDEERVSMWLEDFDAKPWPPRTLRATPTPHGRMRDTPNGVPASKALRMIDDEGIKRPRKFEPIGYKAPSEKCVNLWGRFARRQTVSGIKLRVLEEEEEKQNEVQQEREDDEANAEDEKEIEVESEAGDGEEKDFYKQDQTQQNEAPALEQPDGETEDEEMTMQEKMWAEICKEMGWLETKVEEAEAQPAGREAEEKKGEEEEENEGSIFQGRRCGDINPIFKNNHRPWTEIANEHMNMFPHLFDEVRRGRISYGRQFWVGCNLEVYDMDRISLLVCGLKLSSVKDKDEAFARRFIISQALQHMLEREVAERRAVVCATDGCVRPEVEFTEDGARKEEVRGGCGLVMFHGDPARPRAVRSMPMVGVCGIEPDSFDTETTAAQLVPDMIGDELRTVEDRQGVTTIYVVGDSNSLMSALDNFSDDSNAILMPLMRELERLPRMFERDIKIVFLWIPGHSGSLYNDAADFVAERATHWGPIGSLPEVYAAKTLTPSILRRVLYSSTRHLRAPFTSSPSPYFKARFDVLGAFRPPSGLFRSQELEHLYFCMWVGYCHTGTLGMGPILYEGKNAGPVHKCTLCGEKVATGIDHLLFSCDAEITTLEQDDDSMICVEVDCHSPPQPEEAGVGQNPINKLSQIREGCGLPHQKVPKAAEAAHYLRKEPRKVVDFVRLASSRFKGVLNKRMMEVVQFENLPREGRGMDASEERKQMVASSVTAEKLATTMAILQTC